MNEKNKLVIAVREFTVVPGARYIDDGDGSAEEFFKKYFVPLVDKNDAANFLIDFDGTWGYASSFISELAKDIKINYGKEFIEKRLSYKSDEDLMLIDRFKNELAQDYS